MQVKECFECEHNAVALQGVREIDFREACAVIELCEREFQYLCDNAPNLIPL